MRRLLLNGAFIGAAVRPFPICLIALGLLTGWGSAFAGVVSVGALQDAMIFGTAAGVDTGNASGKGPALFAGADGGSNRKRSLIEFDIGAANIPAGATVTGVTMTLYLGQIAGSGMGGAGGNFPSRTIRLYDLLQDWGEGNSGSPTSPTIGGTGQGFPRQNGDSTWDYAFFDPTTPTTWNSGGTDLHGGNFSATQSAESTFTFPFTLNAAYTWSSAGMVADVQAWLDGTAPNYGWLLKSDLETNPTSFIGFWSKDGAAANNNPAIAPSLQITFSTAVPEPGTFGLVLAGLAVLGGVLLRRKSRPCPRSREG